MEYKIKSPILNNPYEEPLYHYGSTEGNLDYNTVLGGRRHFSMVNCYEQLIRLAGRQFDVETMKRVLKKEAVKNNLMAA